MPGKKFTAYLGKRAERLEAMRKAWEDEKKDSNVIGEAFGVRPDSVRRLARKYKWARKIPNMVTHVKPGTVIAVPVDPRLIPTLPPHESYKEWRKNAAVKYAALDAYIREWYDDQRKKDESEGRNDAAKRSVHEKIQEYRRKTRS